jgi:hypothetical protein
MHRFVVGTMAVFLVTIATTPGPALARTVELPSGATAACDADTDQPSDAAAKWKVEAQRIPLGIKIKIKTTSGKTLKGVLRAAGDTGVTIERQEANPVSPADVPYSEIHKIERGGMGWGAKIAIVAGVVGGTILIILAAGAGNYAG